MTIFMAGNKEWNDIMVCAPKRAEGIRMKKRRGWSLDAV